MLNALNLHLNPSCSSYSAHHKCHTGPLISLSHCEAFRLKLSWHATPKSNGPINNSSNKPFHRDKHTLSGQFAEAAGSPSHFISVPCWFNADDDDDDVYGAAVKYDTDKSGMHQTETGCKCIGNGAEEWVENVHVTKDGVQRYSTMTARPSSLEHHAEKNEPVKMNDVNKLHRLCGLSFCAGHGGPTNTPKLTYMGLDGCRWVW